MNLPEEITIYKDGVCKKSTDFVWGRQIPDIVCDHLIEFWENQHFLRVQPGQVYSQGDVQTDHEIKESMDCIVPHQTVSYTHLTLPTSDLV